MTITDPGGLTATSSVSVTVNQTLSTIAVSPTSAEPQRGSDAAVHGHGQRPVRRGVACSRRSPGRRTAGTIGAGGLLTAPETSVSGTVTAVSGAVSGTSAVTVTNHLPTVATAASASPSPVTGTTTSLSVLGADQDTGESSLTYSWARRPAHRAAATFSANGSNTAKNTTATFSQAGTYTFTVTITDPGGLTATSSVSVTVNQTLSSDRGQPGVG